MSKVETITDNKGKKFHNISGVYIECSGKDCNLCKMTTEERFEKWESSIPFPVPPKGKKYKKKRIQELRGKTIQEICYTCPMVDQPCYVCSRRKCEYWMKEENRKGQEFGCVSYENGRCKDFVCKRGIIKTKW
ncbi:MAG: hypothetical protein SVO01_07785 [Thermotogota bacterium]|nr:hypothetical protein [Thermotogota bacterium]